MLILLSPAKSLDLASPLPPHVPNQPRFLETSAKLATAAARLSADDIAALMHVSAPLAELNAARFAAFQTPFTPENARPALFTFAGDVYSGLDAATLDAKALDFAQAHLRILSGLYGLLRPLDLIQPYRLEMGLSFGLAPARTLYATWGDRLAKALDADLAGQDRALIINLASTEYTTAIPARALQAPVLTIDFRDEKAGRLRFNSYVAKRARGVAARALLQAGSEDPALLKDKDILGHRFSSAHSEPDRWMFVRTPG